MKFNLSLNQNIDYVQVNLTVLRSDTLIPGLGYVVNVQYTYNITKYRLQIT